MTVTSESLAADVETAFPRSVPECFMLYYIYNDLGLPNRFYMN